LFAITSGPRRSASVTTESRKGQRCVGGRLRGHDENMSNIN
jgi:hypothetical protein